MALLKAAVPVSKRAYAPLLLYSQCSSSTDLHSIVGVRRCSLCQQDTNGREPWRMWLYLLMTRYGAGR